MFEGIGGGEKGWGNEIVVRTAFADMYAKSGNMEEARFVFDGIVQRDVGTWTALINVYILNGDVRAALRLFIDELSTYICHPPRFAASFEHAFLPYKSRIYSQHLSGIPNENKDIYLWSVIIAGYGAHGHGEIAVSLFKEMVQAGVKPNEITFTSVMHACCHAGLVDEGLDFFKFMLRNHQISPQTDHYTCIVDLLGCSGRPDEAYDIIRTMPFAPSHAVWGALLGASVIHENVELGEIAAKWLFELELENTGKYVLMAKIYSAVGRWKDAENMRCLINEIGLQKAAAHSLIQVRNM
ncbi:hypothetical protein REPUB_Repub10bG0056100 [Reevesia pubescens]